MREMEAECAKTTAAGSKQINAKQEDNMHRYQIEVDHHIERIQNGEGMGDEYVEQQCA